ncbi:hypothetical protein MELLADRAFT_90060 [Melampsora larici-populina 98AG31]|uniref:Uncharacterized protein n=1 Tax=Melampsora larici-populina (strain 98AG31 / pathotype 3-4-7) TaxID=747676 RepID=F4RVK3_MELLP|nr:hypothetical protein MELLADRAFT_90060 [Melampsora larici-populina 98AG31]
MTESPVKLYDRDTESGTTQIDFDYELFNVNNFNIRYWSWNYRGCWHQTCPPIDPRPLSGIEPLFPVTRHHHGRPLSYHRKLIGQIFE